MGRFPVRLAMSFALLALALAASARPAAQATPSARVGAFFFDGWSGELGNFHWGGLLGTQYSGRRPLSGWTDDRPEAVEAQLRWARTAGLSFFVFDWYQDPHPGNGPINMAFETYWKLRDHSGVGAALAYVNQPGFVVPPARWQDVVDKWASTFFSQPDYVRIDGKPLLVILDEAFFIRQWGGAAGANDAIAALQEAARRRGLRGVFVVGGRYFDWGSEQCFPKCLDTDEAFSSVHYDAITEFTYPYILEPRDGPRQYGEAAVAVKRAWATIAERSPFPHIPSVMAGFDPRPMILAGQIQSKEEGGWPLLNGHETWWVTRPADVGGLVRDAISWVGAHPSMRVEPAPAVPVVLIQSWNELQEGAIVVPTDADGYGYMQAVADAVGIPWATPPQRTMRVGVSPRGVVTSAPAGIACPPRCTGSFDEGWEVTLTARPHRGSTVDAWTEGCRESESGRSCSVVLVRDSTARPILTSTSQRRRLTLSIAGRTARGRITALDGYRECVRHEPVQLQHRRNGHWVVTSSVGSDVRGVFAARLPAAPGTYRAVIVRHPLGNHTCLAAVSQPVTRRGS